MIAIRKCSVCGTIFEAQVGIPGTMCKNCTAGKTAYKPWQKHIFEEDTWYEEEYEKLEIGEEQERKQGLMDNEDDILMEQIENEIAEVEIRNIKAEVISEIKTKLKQSTNKSKSKQNKSSKVSSSKNTPIKQIGKNPYLALIDDSKEDK